jgi:hypothetical protein
MKASTSASRLDWASLRQSFYRSLHAWIYERTDVVPSSSPVFASHFDFIRAGPSKRGAGTRMAVL